MTPSLLYVTHSFVLLDIFHLHYTFSGKRSTRLKQINSPDLGNSFVVFPEQEEGTGTNCDNCRLSIIYYT